MIRFVVPVIAAILALPAAAQKCKIDHLKPPSAPAGLGLAINGSGFKPTKIPKGAKLHVLVHFDAEPVSVANAGDTTIQVRIPVKMKIGIYKVQVTIMKEINGQKSVFKKSNKINFTVAPRVSKIEPGSGATPTILTITGGPFVPKTGAGKPVVFFNNKPLSSKLSEDGKRITCRITKAAKGTHTIVVKMGRSKTAPASKPRNWVCVGALKSFKVPVLSKVTPAKPKPGQTLTIKGKNFRQGVYVLIDGKKSATRLVDDKTLTTRLNVKLTPGSHTVRVGVDKPTKQMSVQKKFNIAGFTPKLTGVSPPSSVPGAPIRVNGTELGPGTKITWNGVTVKTSLRGTTQAGFNVPSNAAPGTYSIGAVNGKSKSNTVKLKIVALKPVLKDINPKKAMPGDFVSVSGDQFGYDKNAKTTVFVNDKPAATQFYGNNSLRFMITPGTPPGKYKVDVRQGTKRTKALTIEVGVRKPTLRSVKRQVQAGAELEILGKGFLAGSKVQLGGRVLEHVKLEYSQIIVQVPRDLAPGNYVLTVVVPQAGTTEGRKVQVLKAPDEEPEDGAGSGSGG